MLLPFLPNLSFHELSRNWLEKGGACFFITLELCFRHGSGRNGASSPYPITGFCWLISCLLHTTDGPSSLFQNEGL